MATPDTISPIQLGRLIGTPDAPVIIDVRVDEDVDLDPRFLPGSTRRAHATVATWAAEFAGRSVVTVCQRGGKLAQGTAAWLRHLGASAETLEGGFEAWSEAGNLLVTPAHVPARDDQGRTIWVTRTRGRRSTASPALG